MVNKSLFFYLKVHYDDLGSLYGEVKKVHLDIGLVLFLSDNGTLDVSLTYGILCIMMT